MIFEFVAYLIVQATSLLVGGLIWVITFPIRETRSIIVNAQRETIALAAAVLILGSFRMNTSEETHS